VQLLPLLILVEPTLKGIIDSAYVRHDETSIAASTLAPVEADVEAPVEDEDTAEDPAALPVADSDADPLAAEEPTPDPVDEPAMDADSVPGRNATTGVNAAQSAERGASPRSARTGRGSEPSDG
jgi:hypothetical protein